MLRIALLLVALLLPGLSLAWGKFGHELVASLAEAQLNESARTEIAALLAIEGSPDLAAVAGWADLARDTDEFAWTRPLHFINFSGRQCADGRARVCVDGECIVDAVERFRAELADRQRLPLQRLQALKFLVHFVGDIHQPLHAGRGEDKGGNTYQVNLAGEGSNLHRVWDFELLASRGLPFAEHRALLLRADRAVPGSVSAMDWALESCALVNGRDFYPPTRRVGADYIERQRSLAETRIGLAASRLAALLNAVFAQSSALSAVPER